MIRVQLFGGVSVTGEDGEPVDVGPRRRQSVLAALALSPGLAVPVPRLVQLVWGDNPPRTAEKTLQSYITRLRKSLGADSIVRIGAAYRLNLEPGAVDVVRFQNALAAGDIPGALVEWTGDPLAGLETGGLAVAVDSLVEQWLGAVEIDLEWLVDSEPHLAIGMLTELTAGHRFREGLWALYMTALYRVGRQADALAAYRCAREHLVEALGVEPGPRLRELESSILNHDPALVVPRSRPGPRSVPVGRRPLTERDGIRHHLPVQNTKLFGRDDEIAAVADLVGRHRLVTLTAMGGVGKTRLALAVAAEQVTDFEDGVFFASLADIDDPGQVSRVVGDALGITVGSNDSTSVARFVAARRLLIVVDNCEHLLDGVTDLVEAVLASGSAGRVLATSREALEVEGEQIFVVAPLASATADSPGVRLLVDRGRRVRPDLEAEDASLTALIETCTRLDGIPLALELAAAQLAHLSPVELAERLDDRFRLLVRGRPARPNRRRALQATMDWSWDLLGHNEQEVLSRLSVFAGGWTVEAAEGVCGTESTAPTTAVLRSLVAKSLVVRESNGQRSRYRMLETVRIYAAHKLLEAGATRKTRQRHASFYCSAAEAVSFSDRFMIPAVGVQWSAETENVIAVVDWLRQEGSLPDTSVLLTMAASTWRFVRAPQPLLAAIEDLLDGPLDDLSRCLLLIAHAEAAIGRRGARTGGRTLGQIVELARALADDGLLSAGLTMEGSSYGASDPDRAEQLLTVAAERADRIGDHRLAAMALGQLGGVQAFGRRHLGGVRELVDGARSRASGDGFENHVILSQLLAAEVLSGDWRAGYRAYRELAAFRAEAGYPVDWINAIDEAVFAIELGDAPVRPLARAVAELEAAGGRPELPDLLTIPLSQACRRSDWVGAWRVVATIRATARAGRNFATSHATAYYYNYRSRIPPEARHNDDTPQLADILASELAREGTGP